MYDVVAKEVFRLIDELGYQIVPVEPTSKMLEACDEYGGVSWLMGGDHGIWKAMLHAAKEEDNG